MGPYIGRRVEEQPSSDRRSLAEPPQTLVHNAFLRAELDGNKRQKSIISSLMQRRCILLGTFVLLLVHAVLSSYLVPVYLGARQPVVDKDGESRDDFVIPYREKVMDTFIHSHVGQEVFSRLLSETASTLHIQGLLDHHRGADGSVSGLVSGFANPLIRPPETVEMAKNASNIRQEAPLRLEVMHVEKCANIADPTFEDTRGKEWVMSSKTWVKRYGKNVSRYKWCRGGKRAEVPSLERIQMYQSRKKIPSRAVTIVTQLSIERLAMLEQQCSHWPHTISAVVYIPLVEGLISSTEDEMWNGMPLKEGLQEVERLLAKENKLKCILDLEVVAEERCTSELATLYPTNGVRNRALINSRSDIVLLLDVDFVVDMSLAYVLEHQEQHQELMDMLSSEVAVVLPAFEAWDQGERGRDIALTAVREGKSYIAKKFMYNVVMGFHMAHYPQGHEPTQFWKWINTSTPYPVQHEIGFEPYILMAKKYVPYYDERFRGYYFNKVEQLLHISSQLGFPFIVHPTSFVVHVPHTKAKTKWRTKRTGQKERNHAMFLDALGDMNLHRFVPVTAFPHLCLPFEIQTAVAETMMRNQMTDARALMFNRMAEQVIISEEEQMHRRQHARPPPLVASGKSKNSNPSKKAEHHT
eukprot:jgi/Picsp_1/1311/NSC_04792-R1_glycosyltransferase-like protein large1-like